MWAAGKWKLGGGSAFQIFAFSPGYKGSRCRLASISFVSGVILSHRARYAIVHKSDCHLRLQVESLLLLRHSQIKQNCLFHTVEIP